MGIISRTADLFYTFRFLKVLVTPWEEMKAFKLGIIDKDGKPLKRSNEFTTEAERSSYTPFHRLVFHIKRLLNKIPFGKSKIASYAAALWLIKEETGMSEGKLLQIMEELDVPVEMTLTENTWFLNENGALQPGVYQLIQDVAMFDTKDFRARAGTKIDVNEACEPLGYFSGIPIFKVRHRDTGRDVIISTEDINR